MSFLLFITLTSPDSRGQCYSLLETVPLIKKSIQEQDTTKLNHYIKNWDVCKFSKDTSYVYLIESSAELFYYIKAYNSAIKLYDKLIQNKNLKNLTNYNLLKYHLRLGECYYYIQNYDYAKKEIEKINQKENYNTKTLIEANRYLSAILYDEGDYETSVKYIDKAITLAKQLNDSFEIASLFNLKSNSFRNNLEFTNAIFFANQALKYALITNDRELITRQYLMLAKIYTDIKDFKQTIFYFTKAVDFIGNSNNYLRNSIFINFGFFYLNNLKDYGRAIYYFNKSLENNTDKFQRLRSLNNIAYCYGQKKEYITALYNYQKALNEIDKTNILNKLDYNPTLDIQKKCSKKEYLLTLIHDKAETWKDYFQNSQQNYQLVNAISTFLTADKLIDYMRHEHTGTQSKFFWRNKTRPIYESAIETCFLLKDYQKAFYFFEKSRSVLLNDKLNELGAKQKLSEADLQREKNFLKQISELNSSIENEKNAKLKADLNNKLLDLQEQQDRFIKSLETKNPAYYQLKYNTQTADLKTVQDYLKGIGGGTLVEYFVGDSATYSIVVSPTNVAIRKLKYDLSDSQKLLTFCFKNLSTKAELAEFNSLSYKIYQSLIEPLHLPKGRLIISQDGAFLPFEALSKAANRAEYMVNDYMISYTYSAQFLLKNQQKKGFLLNKQFIGFAPVNFAQKLNPLIGSDESLDKISKNYFWNTTLTAHEGNKKAFLENAPKFQIVQIYTHAFADSNESEPRIYFADSTLKVSELGLQDRFKTNLLVLAACRTGVGKVAKGEGVLSLARGFSMLGIPATVTSLWSVEDKDTYKLTELFYSHLNEGLSKDEALQKAKIEMLKENPSPNVWAGLVLIGDSSKIESDKLYLWISGLLLITLVLLFSRSLRKTK